jgi:hypothetical protein
MKIQRSALVALRDHVADPAGAAKGLRHELTKPKDQLDPADPGPGEGRWKLQGDFVLDCCEAIGRLAASLAVSRGSRTIQLPDLKQAFKVVSDQNHGRLPGPFCPNFP